MCKKMVHFIQLRLHIAAEIGEITLNKGVTNVLEHLGMIFRDFHFTISLRILNSF